MPKIQINIDTIVPMLEYLESSIWLQLIVGMGVMFGGYYLLKNILHPRYYVRSGVIIFGLVFLVIYFLPNTAGIGIIYIALCATAAGLVVEGRKSKT